MEVFRVFIKWIGFLELGFSFLNSCRGLVIGNDIYYLRCFRRRLIYCKFLIRVSDDGGRRFSVY